MIDAMRRKSVVVMTYSSLPTVKSPSVELFPPTVDRGSRTFDPSSLRSDSPIAPQQVGGRPNKARCRRRRGGPERPDGALTTSKLFVIARVVLGMRRRRAP